MLVNLSGLLFRAVSNQVIGDLGGVCAVAPRAPSALEETARPGLKERV